MRNLYGFGGKYSGFFYNRNVVGNNPETAGAGEDRQNSFRRLSRSIICMPSSQNFCSASLCTFSQATHVDATEYKAIKGCRIEHESLHNSLTDYQLQASKDGKNTGVREKKKKTFCTFLANSEGFLILQHSESTILILLQAQCFLLPATLWRRAKQACMSMARAGKIVCSPFPFH